MTNRFASIENSHKLVYVFDSTHRFELHAGINPAFRYFDTYGDGTTQHSPSMPVGVEQLTDYLFSLAQAMIADPELCDNVSGDLRNARPDAAALAFAFNIEHKEGKTRYYSVSERKVTAADKRHDKRYERVEPRHDGSIDAAYDILWKDYYNGFQMLNLMHAVKAGVDWYTPPTSALLKWTAVAIPERLDNALDACHAILRARDAMAYAERAVRNHLRNLEHEREEAAKAAAAPATEEVA